MKTESELDQDILSITMKIQDEFPELSKYLIETPVQFSESDCSGVNRKTLEDYYDSLNELLKRYSQKHLKIEKIE